MKFINIRVRLFNAFYGFVRKVTRSSIYRVYTRNLLFFKKKKKPESKNMRVK